MAPDRPAATAQGAPCRRAVRLILRWIATTWSAERTPGGGRRPAARPREVNCPVSRRRAAWRRMDSLLVDGWRQPTIEIRGLMTMAAFSPDEPGSGSPSPAARLRSMQPAGPSRAVLACPETYEGGGRRRDVVRLEPCVRRTPMTDEGHLSQRCRAAGLSAVLRGMTRVGRGVQARWPRNRQPGEGPGPDDDGQGHGRAAKSYRDRDAQ